MERQFRSPCAIASALDIVGDKWSLVVIRSLMFGASSYGDILGEPEKIATNILADRLQRLEAAGLIAADLPLDGRKGRRGYRLTRAGADLLPVVQAIGAWGESHIPGRWPIPPWFKSARPEDLLDRPAALAAREPAAGERAEGVGPASEPRRRRPPVKKSARVSRP